eukprot:GEZU01024989.1.p1 GENE.GEZU01024989.1~~GEZU01024989.1.p1  ORF type:complete len:120 (+),score=8.53 GEZU01024989.1:543-902(+)
MYIHTTTTTITTTIPCPAHLLLHISHSIQRELELELRSKEISFGSKLPIELYMTHTYKLFLKINTSAAVASGRAEPDMTVISEIQVGTRSLQSPLLLQYQYPFYEHNAIYLYSGKLYLC